mmetsp:Transcript_6456/g.13532  ORF Transcript_6456/g.13532 Transcript_6456/m.13532 type:complete len:293 (+) Transcript_6456:145-1023(+)
MTKSQSASSGGGDANPSCRPSIRLIAVRHAESMNNLIYEEAHRLHGNGTASFDARAWQEYVEGRRVPDPGLSTKGHSQADALGRHLAVELAGDEVRVVTSPMARTLDTTRSVLGCVLEKKIAVGGGGDVRLEAVVNAKYYEVEGCHEGGEPRSGKNGPGAQEYLLSEPLPEGGGVDVTYACFPPGGGGWYTGATGPEDRVHAESRSALFYTWLVDYLDELLYCSPGGAGKGTSRPKRTVVLVGELVFRGGALRQPFLFEKPILRVPAEYRSRGFYGVFSAKGCCRLRTHCRT